MQVPPETEQTPTVRPLGYIALGLGGLAALLAATGWFAVYGVVVAIPAIALGEVCRREPEIADMGRVAIGLGLAAIVIAVFSVTLFFI